MWGFVDDVDVWRGWVGDADRDRGCKFITTHLVHVRALTRTRFHLCRGEGAGTGATARAALGGLDYLYVTAFT